MGEKAERTGTIQPDILKYLMGLEVRVGRAVETDFPAAHCA